MAIKGPPVAPTSGEQPLDVKGTSSVDSAVKSHIEGTLSGKIKRYDDKTVSQMKQGVFETTRGQAKQSKRNLKSELAKSGTLRSGALGRGIVDIDNAANASFTQGVRDIMLEKAKAEFDDKNVAVQQAQAWLKSKQDYDLGLKQISATLESARISAGATLGAAKLGADASRAAAGAAAGAARYAADQSFQLGMANVQLKDNALKLQAAAMGLG
jgi:hypothetical protein